MVTAIILAAFLAAPPWADPFTPAGPLALTDFYAPPRPPEKPSPYAHETAADGLEWWALEQDWGQAVTEAAPVLTTLASRQNQRIVYSALQCHTLALLLDPDVHATETARKRLIAINLLATERLERARIVPLPCDAWPVARLVGCLGLLPSTECTTDAELAALAAAAERIAP